jgi:hypothetical protein
MHHRHGHPGEALMQLPHPGGMQPDGEHAGVAFHQFRRQRSPACANIALNRWCARPGARPCPGSVP